MKITDKDRLDFIEKVFHKLSWYPYTSSHKEGIQRRYFLTTIKNSDECYQGNSIREAIDNSIMAMREKDK